MEIWAECAKNRILFISILLLSDTEKNHGICQDIRSSGGDSNAGLPDYQTKVKIFAGFSWL
jgi:hypothetical protein